jgi:hypothetical protein
MKRTCTTLLAATVAVVAGACSQSRPSVPPPAEVQPRISAADAVNQIAAAKCDREQRCNQMASKPTSADTNECRLAVKHDIDKDFGDRAACRNGVSKTDLDQCVAKLDAQDCGVVGTLTEGIQTSMACGPSDLCLD